MMKSYLTAAKHPSVKGFTLLETLIVLMILTLVASASMDPIDLFLYQKTQDQIIHTQTRALFRRAGETMKPDDKIAYYAEIKFNAKGNVRTAQTLRFEGTRKIVILLGPGRIHE